MKPLVIELKEQQSAQAERCIAENIAKVAASQAPSIDYVAGMIDLAYVLGCYRKDRRDVLLEQLRRVVNHRRSELHHQHLDRLLMRNQA